jgi:hypothetical protein
MCLDRNQQTFIGPYFNPHINALVSKGLIIPSNLSDTLNCPLTIPDFVWDYLLENKTNFLPENIDDLRLVSQRYESLRDWQRKDFP